MKVLVVGSGGREHALVRSLLRDPGVRTVAAAPGNAGIAADAEVLPLDVSDPGAVADLAQHIAADLVVVGPEVALVNGAADAVRARGIACFGPSADAARLEGSKTYAKQIMEAAGVPTADSQTCETLAEVEGSLDSFGPPYVVKDDGLAAGKGVVVTQSRTDAIAHAEECLAKGSPQVVVEEFLDGPEVSLFVISDGTTCRPLLPAQDFKRVGDGDVGPNTGGMGAYCPLPWAPDDLVAAIMRDVAEPTIAEMARSGNPFEGVLYCGLALTSRGLRVVEFNCRFGDPEIQTVLALLDSPLSPLLDAAARGRLAEADPPRWRSGFAVNVVIASQGYPDRPVVGDPVSGLAEASAVEGVHVLHAGTSRDPGGELVTSGGRVLSVVGTGPSLADARDRAMRAVELVRIRGCQHRTDIAADAISGLTLPFRPTA
ncbi:MAG: phosphoribosylamine--glycine ligase [Candidatus Nanopelagicales bacterium]|nr:phosphoribosylamine--glycine ligase [Candidatus Nanopelagicales bacterium]